MIMIQKCLFRVCFQPITTLNCCTTSHGKQDHIIHNSPAIMNIRPFVTILSRNPQYNFSKMRGGIKGRLELFRKFIRFGIVLRPLVSSHFHFFFPPFYTFTLLQYLPNLTKILHVKDFCDMQSSSRKQCRNYVLFNF